MTGKEVLVNAAFRLAQAGLMNVELAPEAEILRAKAGEMLASGSSHQDVMTELGRMVDHQDLVGSYVARVAQNRALKW